MNISLRRWLILFFALFVAVSTAQAGFISTLSKLGKAGKSGDIDVPEIRGNLPEGLSADDLVTVRLNNSGQWEVHSKDGSRHSFSDVTSGLTDQSPKAVILDSFYLPKDLNSFHNLPNDLPILIRSKTDRIFELQRPEVSSLSRVTSENTSWRLKDRAVSMKVTDAKELRSAIWHLEKPIIAGTPRLLSVQSNVAGKGQNVLSDETGRFIRPIEIQASDVISSFSQMKRETVVLAGRLDDQKMHIGTDQLLDITSLKKAAESNDINLVLLNTSEPKAALDRLAMDLTLRDRNDTSVGTFFNQYIAGVSPNSQRDPVRPVLELERSDSGDSQVLIQWEASKLGSKQLDGDSSNKESMAHLAVHSTLHSIKIFHPDEMRSDELESRIIPWLHSFIQTYLIASAVLGFMAIVTSWRAWNYLWKLQRPARWCGWFVYAAVWPVHKVLFLVAFLPIAGFFTFWYIVLTTAWYILSFLVNRVFIAPVSWLLGKFRGS
jgi:hypothetical protein